MHSVLFFLPRVDFLLSYCYNKFSINSCEFIRMHGFYESYS